MTTRRSSSVLLLITASLATASCAHHKAMARGEQQAAPAQQSSAAPSMTSAPANQGAAAPMTFAQASNGAAIHEFWGVVKSIKAASGQVTVRSKKGSVKAFSIVSDTSFTKGGKKKTIMLSDIKKGDHVRVYYSGAYAQRIHVYVR